MLFISIPVHEKLSVIVNQCQNIVKFIDAQIVLHRSSQADFTSQQLREMLKNHHLSYRLFVNPCSMQTWWGSILHAHLSNVEYIKNLSQNVNNDFVIFHASNDMIVRSGVTPYVLNHGKIYHTRRYLKPGNYWPVANAFTDEKFLKLRQDLKFGEGIIASQIEGSAYPLALLIEISKIISSTGVLHNDKVWYPREEVLLPTIAYAIGEKPNAEPYVFSELHRIDYWSWKAWNSIDRLYPLSRGKGFIKRQVHKMIVGSHLLSISIRDVDRIRENRIRVYGFDDGACYWKPYTNPQDIFGVKRVSRDMNDSLRQYISRL